MLNSKYEVPAGSRILLKHMDNYFHGSFDAEHEELRLERVLLSEAMHCCANKDIMSISWDTSSAVE